MVGVAPLREQMRRGRPRKRGPPRHHLDRLRRSGCLHPISLEVSTAAIQRSLQLPATSRLPDAAWAADVSYEDWIPRYQCEGSSPHDIISDVCKKVKAAAEKINLFGSTQAECTVADAVLLLGTARMIGSERLHRDCSVLRREFSNLQFNVCLQGTLEMVRAQLLPSFSCQNSSVV